MTAPLLVCMATVTAACMAVVMTAVTVSMMTPQDCKDDYINSDSRHGEHEHHCTNYLHQLSLCHE